MTQFWPGRYNDRSKVWEGEAGSPGSSSAELEKQAGNAADAPASNGVSGRGSAESTAIRGDVSVAEIKRLQVAGELARHEEALLLREKASEYEERGENGVARVYYQQAAKRATGELLDELHSKLVELGTRR